jgi:hypothetical protein
MFCEKCFEILSLKSYAAWKYSLVCYVKCHELNLDEQIVPF